MPYGIFIEFSQNVYGLAPNSVSIYFKSLLHIVMYKYLPACNINFYFQMLSDKFIADSSQHFKIGQSVHAKVSTLCFFKKKKNCVFSLYCFPLF